jgi:hypothetical protein
MRSPYCLYVYPLVSMHPHNFCQLGYEITLLSLCLRVFHINFC